MSSGPLLPGKGSAPVHLLIPPSNAQHGSPAEGPRKKLEGVGQAQWGTEHNGTHDTRAPDLGTADSGGKEEDRSEENEATRLNPLAREFVPLVGAKGGAPIDIPGRRQDGLRKGHGTTPAKHLSERNSRPKNSATGSGTWRPKSAVASGSPNHVSEPASRPGKPGSATTPRSGGGAGGHHGRGSSPKQGPHPSFGTEVSPGPGRQAASAAGFRGSDLNQGRKGGMVSGNHLLNFQYESRTGPRPGLRPLPRNGRRRSQQPYNKELFLQANFHFLASDLADYTQVASDPDRMLDWEDVAAVDVSASAPVQCPICLDSPPMCPQITSCGHVFCFPCIIRYLMMGSQDKSGDHWKKCPLCFSQTCCKDLRMTTITPVTKRAVGDSVRFTLLARSKGSAIPFERSNLAPPGLPVIPPLTPPYASEDALKGEVPPRCSRFAKLTLTSATSALTRTAIRELQEWAETVQEAGAMEDREVLPYVYAAMDQLQSRMNAWIEHRETELLSVSPPVRHRPIGQMLQPRTPGQNAAGASSSPPGNPTPEARSSANERAAKVSDGGPTAAAGAQEKDLQIQLANAMAELKEKESWVYESAFSDDEDGVHHNRTMPSAGQKPASSAAWEGASQLEDGATEWEREGGSGMAASKFGGEASSLEGSSWEAKGALSKQLEHDPSKKGKGKEGEQRSGANGKGEERDYYMFYQAEDGQMLIVHPLSMKCLLHHYGSYDALPMNLEATIVDLESVTQTDATRKRYRYLSHLPLTATFQFCEVDVAPLLPSSSLAPFAEELRLREQKRSRREQQEREARAREERQAQEKAASAAALLPKPPNDDDFQAILTAIAISESLTPTSPGQATDQAGAAASSPPPPVQENKLFSSVTKLGYAAGHDAPDLVLHNQPSAPRLSPGTTPPPLWAIGSPPPIPGSQESPWGRLPGQHSFAAVIASDGPKAAEKEREEEEAAKLLTGKKGKKGTKMLLSTSSARRY